MTERAALTIKVPPTARVPASVKGVVNVVVPLPITKLPLALTVMVPPTVWVALSARVPTLTFTVPELLKATPLNVVVPLPAWLKVPLLMKMLLPP